MEETQSFRLTETMNTAKLTLSHVGAQNIVQWEDIERVFPGVKRVHNGYSVITFSRNSTQENPPLLDVVLSTTVKHDHAGTSSSDTPANSSTTVLDISDQVFWRFDILSRCISITCSHNSTCQ
ncbi:unnamed protein product [Mortierella alpina]